MRRRLDLASGLVGQPSVIFLDEPTTGLDLPSRQAMWEVIAEQVSRGVSVLLTTQYLEEADRLADTHRRRRRRAVGRDRHARRAQARRSPTSDWISPSPTTMPTGRSSTAWVHA